MKNPHFDFDIKSEQGLYEDLIIEALSIYGQLICYLPRNIITQDMILNEQIESRFDDGFFMTGYIENTDAFGGEGDLLSKFGFQIRDECTFIIAKSVFNSTLGRHANLIQPNEGDLIYLPISKSFFEISHVEHEQPFYQLEDLPIYKLKCALYEYSGEDFDTNIEPIEDMLDQYANSIQIKIEDWRIEEFYDNPFVYQIIQSDINNIPNIYLQGRVINTMLLNDTMLMLDIIELQLIGSNDPLLAKFRISKPEEYDTYLTTNISNADRDMKTDQMAKIVEIDDINSDPYASNEDFGSDSENIFDSNIIRRLGT